MNKQTAFIIYRILTRLHSQADFAFRAGREDDARSMWRLISRLEYLHFEGVTCEQSLREVA